MTRRPRTSTAVAWGFGLLLVLAWAAGLLLLAHQRDQALQAEQQHNAQLAAQLQARTGQVIAGADQALRQIRDALRAGTPPDLVRLAAASGLGKALVQLSLVGPDGHFVGSSLDPGGQQTGPIDLNEREHIQAVLHPPAGGNADAIFIGKPVLGKVSQRWTIQLSRRLVAEDGRTLGVGVASLDPTHFESLYRTVPLGQLGSVALVGPDLRVRARVLGGVSQGMGSDLPANHPLVTAGWPPSGSGVEAHEGADDATDAHIVAFAQVGSYPLHVVVSTASTEAFAEWHSLRNLLLLGGTLGTLMLLLAASITTRRLREREQVSDEDAGAAYPVTEVATEINTEPTPGDAEVPSAKD
ncbi:hypothetical protein LRH25_06985 [Ideonella azotifigens]|uniref:cache domain-containing protein n=1 Tax=Ideonella azotifigens TaxID=513160 RepID=UPI001E37A169|nr:hypothetical protein [Ideonella azotifigens]MCD2340085.1 hypothetical protein [Ideonella azotifigens]